MKDNKKNEELQSRREFFKKAAKGALPIIAAAVMASAPAVVKAAENCLWMFPSGTFGISWHSRVSRGAVVNESDELAHICDFTNIKW